MTTHREILLALAAALLVGACSAGAAPVPGAAGPTAPGARATPGPTKVPGAPGSPGGSAPAGLDGRTFLSTGTTGRVLVAGSRVRLAFEGGRLTASAGCNTLAGTYTLVGGHLAASGLSSTEMGCDAALMEQDAWLAALLASAEVTLDGAALTLAAGSVTVTLADRVVSDPDRPLMGTRWIVDGIESGGAVSSMPAGVTASLTFGAGRVAVETGCNSGGGPIDVADGTITFGDLALTAMACPGDASAAEGAVVAVLRGRVAYTITAGTLTLTAGSGAGGLMLRAAG